jgi:hypothetical protein
VGIAPPPDTLGTSVVAARQSEPEQEFTLPPGMLTRPWRHQQAAYQFCLDHFAAGLNGILLAMGMGTGKSLVACMLALALAARRNLVACPLRVIPVWLSQFERHVSAPVVIVGLDQDAGSVADKRAMAEEKMRLAEARGVPFICIVNYDSAWREPFAAWAETQQWDLVIADECVPADTMITTSAGSVPIQSLAEGDVVLGVDECGRVVEFQVTATFRQFSGRPLVQVDSLVATDNHPVWVEHRGYVPAAEVLIGDQVLVYENHHDHLRVVRSVFHEDGVWWRPEVAATFLRQILLGKMEDEPAGIRCQPDGESRPKEVFRSNEAQFEGSGIHEEAPCLPPFQTESIPRSRSKGQGRGGPPCDGLQDAQRWQRQWTDGCPKDAGGSVGLADGIYRADEDAQRFRLPASLQDRYRGAGIAGRRGGGWTESPGQGTDRPGCEEGRIPGIRGLDRGAGEERRSAGRLRERGAAHLVFNLETSTGNYFANGILVHNCHRLKAPEGKASLFFKRLRLRSRNRIALTGTPMPHGPMDIYAVFRFLEITIFGPSFAAFRQKFAVMGGFQRKQITGFQNLDELERSMGRITFRVGKDVLDLPPETHVTYHCDLGSEGRRIYKDIEDDFVAQVRDNVVTAANALVKLLRLQQVANGIVKTDDGEEHRVDDAKRRLLADTLEDIGSEEPVVVFCRFHQDLDAVHEACEAHGYTSLELSGRRDELKRWQDGEAQVLAVQIQAGGVGVDLTRARYDIFYSLSFSLGDYDQAQSRVHRPGQTRPVEHIHLVARNTVDVRIMRALEKRAEIVDSILAELKN